MSGPLILFIDDDDIGVQPVTEELEWNGYTVERARSLAEGLQAIDRLKLALIILDIRMESDEAGITFLQAIRNRPLAKTTPVIVYSVAGDEDRIYGATMRLGAVVCLEKQSSLSKIVDTVRRYVNQPLVPVVYDAITRSLWIEGIRYEVTEIPKLQSRLLEYFSMHYNEACSYEALIDFVWKVAGAPDTDDRRAPDTDDRKALEQLVRRLRRTIELKCKKKYKLIHPISGFGYRLRLEVPDLDALEDRAGRVGETTL